MTTDLRRWLVGGAVVLADDGVLLVRNRRTGGGHDWSPPGGVIEDHEDLLAGLTREVAEETGLRVTEWRGPIYRIEAAAPGLGWHLRVEVHLAVAWQGAVATEIDDPDGIVEEARFVEVASCGEHLVGGHPWVREPLLEWLAERWEGSRSFAYRVEGRRPGELVVTRG